MESKLKTQIGFVLSFVEKTKLTHYYPTNEQAGDYPEHPEKSLMSRKIKKINLLQHVEVIRILCD